MKLRLQKFVQTFDGVMFSQINIAEQDDQVVVALQIEALPTFQLYQHGILVDHLVCPVKELDSLLKPRIQRMRSIVIPDPISPRNNGQAT
jgi:thioredoxin-like negative regulator of GroEL